jgi:hypothetical protein
MMRRGSRYLRTASFTTRLTLVGVAMLTMGGTLLGTSLAIYSVNAAVTTTSGTTLTLTTSAAGATCNDSNPQSPICSGLASGDVVNVTGTGFSPGATASIVECNSDPAQPVIVFLGQDVPVSCSSLSLVTIPTKGTNKGKLIGSKTMQTGTVGPPVNSSGFPPICYNTSSGSTTTTSTIPDCTTSGSATTDAANYPCPPTAAQQAAGDTCVLAIGDTAGDRGIGTILFGSEPLPTTSTSTTVGISTSTSTSSSTSTSTSSSTSTTTSSSTTTTTTTGGSTTTSLPLPNGPIGSYVSSPSVQLGPGGTVTDTVVVVGNATYGSPTGTVNFYVCQLATTQTLTTGPCSSVASNHLSSTHVQAGGSDTSHATSSTFLPATAGTWCFAATYGGDSHYSPASDNTTSGNLDANECVLVTTGAPTAQSFISQLEVRLGPSGTVNDLVTITGDANEAPTGSVEFFACQTGTTQVFSPGPCATSGTPEDTESLVTGAGNTSSANSVDFLPTTGGTWCFSVLYSGDSNYGPASDNTDDTNLDPYECVLAAATPTTALSTVSSPTVTLGPSGTVTDSVTVGGDSFNGSPTGSVQFFVCQTGTTSSLTTGPCDPTGTPQSTESLTAVAGDNSKTTSASFSPTSAGTWCFSVVYGGDENYLSAEDNTYSGNPDSNECFLAFGLYTITSANHASAKQGSPFSFSVTTFGSPTPVIRKKGILPFGIRFNRGSLHGTTKKTGTFPITITATFGKGKTKHVATQSFTLTVTS